MFRIAVSLLSCLLVSNLAFASEEEAAATFAIAPLQLDAQGPGTLFASIDAAAIDALTYAYLQAQGARDLEFMRGGTIYPVGEGSYSYGEIHRARRWILHRISYTLKPRDVARFHLYPLNRDIVVNRSNERPSRVDLRSVRTVDPLHRPLYILHPSSLTIRAYHGAEGPQFVEVARLRRPVQSPPIAGKCSTDAPSVEESRESIRVAISARPAPRHCLDSIGFDTGSRVEAGSSFIQ